MPKAEIFINFDDERWEHSVFDIENLSKEVLTEVVFENKSIDFLGLGKPVLINLNLSNNAEVHLLNKQFRGKDKPTNVLSFANIDDDGFMDMALAEAEIELGDIIIAYETVASEAMIKGISFKNHYIHLLVHGILHLLGFDHCEDDEAEEMEAMEVRILERLGVENPY